MSLLLWQDEAKSASVELVAPLGLACTLPAPTITVIKTVTVQVVSQGLSGQQVNATISTTWTVLVEPQSLSLAGQDAGTRAFAHDVRVAADAVYDIDEALTFDVPGQGSVFTLAERAREFDIVGPLVFDTVGQGSVFILPARVGEFDIESAREFDILGQESAFALPIRSGVFDAGSAPDLQIVGKTVIDAG
jgi:hypothetical protein